MLYMTWQCFTRRAREVPLETELSISADAYRAELERQRDFHCGLWFWSRLILLLPGLVLFCIGGIADRLWGFIPILAAIIAIGIFEVPLNLRTARSYQGKIGELNGVVGNEKA